MSDRRRLLLIVNPTSGQKKIIPLLPEVFARLSSGGYDVDVKFTLRRGDAAEYVRTLGLTYDTVACCGGDGTLNECVTGLMDLPEAERPAIGYIPCGSTNDFAASLKLPTDILAAADRVAGGEPKSLDIGGFGDRFFTYVASFGAFTESSYSTPQSLKNALGHLAYILDGIKSIGSIRYTELSATAEGEEFSGKFIFGAVCNSTSMGGLLKLKPGQVDFADGLFELMLIRYPENPAELVRILQALTTSRFEDVAGISFRHCREASFRLAAPTPWTIDGEFGGKVTEVTVRNLHNVIRMIL